MTKEAAEGGHSGDWSGGRLSGTTSPPDDIIAKYCQERIALLESES